MAILVYPSSPRETARRWLGGKSPSTRVPKQANINAIARLLSARNKPVYNIKKVANNIVATQRRSFARAVSANIRRRRQKRGENFLMSRGGFRNSILQPNMIRLIASHLTTRRPRTV